MESLSPNIFTADVTSTISFYKALGFSVAMSVPETGDDLVWVMMTNGKVTMMFQTFESLGGDLPEVSRKNGGSLLLYINVPDIKGFYEEINAKVTVLKGLETTFYGATEFSIVDNNGYLLTFAQNE